MMSFPTAARAGGMLLPDELFRIQNVFDRVMSEPWVTKEPQAQREFARFVLTIYSRGMCDPEKLYRFCLVAARAKLVDAQFNELSTQTDPDQ